jgi:hypothetical protein
LCSCACSATGDPELLAPEFHVAMRCRPNARDADQRVARRPTVPAARRGSSRNRC